MHGRTYILALAVLWTVTSCVRTAYPDTPADHRVLLDAIRQVESGGNDRAIGDSCRSRGAFQIQRAYWQEAARHGRVSWDYSRWVWDRQKSEQIVCWYWQKYGATTDEARARIHNGGPRGVSKKATEAYWQRVKVAMPQKG